MNPLSPRSTTLVVITGTSPLKIVTLLPRAHTSFSLACFVVMGRMMPRSGGTVNENDVGLVDLFFGTTYDFSRPGARTVVGALGFVRGSVRRVTKENRPTGRK